MDVRLTILVCFSAAVYLYVKTMAVILIQLRTWLTKVESAGCSSGWSKKEPKALCEGWWKDAVERGFSNSLVKHCIKLIGQKCPEMITRMKTILTRGFNPYDKIETWTYQTIAVGQSERNSPSYFTYKKHKICWDGEELPDCGYWWDVATDTRAEDKYKERCIERILKHCSNMITFVGEVDGQCDKHGTNCQVKTVTYKNSNDEKASYNKQISLKKSRFSFS